MLAYQAYGEGRSPADEGLKGDHFVGKYYVLFNKLMEEDPTAEAKAQELLVQWEAGDPEVRALWQKMKDWVLEGIKVTYARTNVSFDLYDFESETYELGVDEVLAGLAKGVFFKEDDGSYSIAIYDDQVSSGLKAVLLCASTEILRNLSGTGQIQDKDQKLVPKNFIESLLPDLGIVV